MELGTIGIVYNTNIAQLREPGSCSSAELEEGEIVDMDSQAETGVSQESQEGDNQEGDTKEESQEAGTAEEGQDAEPAKKGRRIRRTRRLRRVSRV